MGKRLGWSLLLQVRGSRVHLTGHDYRCYKQQRDDGQYIQYHIHSSRVGQLLWFVLALVQYNNT